MAIARKPSAGFTLVELMITLAVLTVLAGIAIPAYNGYIRETRLATARTNIEPLRIALEDFWLENSTYGNTDGTDRAEVWVPNGANTLTSGSLGWKPDGDEDQFNYSVIANATSYFISVTHTALLGDPVIFEKVP